MAPALSFIPAINGLLRVEVRCRFQTHAARSGYQEREI
jgi:hypothetical protein